MLEPNSPPEPSSELGLGGNTDLAFTGSVDDVTHPGRSEEQTDDKSVDSSEEKHHENIS
ncbi:hypothetical protein IID21_02525 [Patescibacteria group bacterium]|nr:hypothetical protein [Patescibacteria group bacterium]